jgi:hypothetical protein
MLKRLDWPTIPFIIAFVLGGFIERNLSLGVDLVKVGRLHPLERPASLAIMLVIVVSLAWMLRGGIPPARRVDPKRADVAMSWLLAAGAAIFAWTSLAGAPAYSLFAQGTAWCCFLAILATASLQTIRLVRYRAQGGEPIVSIPESHRTPLVMLVLLPVFIWLVGLPWALAAFALAWLLAGQRPTWRSGGIAVGAALTAMAASWLYLDRVAVIDLPLPALSSLVSAASDLK